METNPQTELARRYVEQTGVSVFLTGKAGTGKTTFLHDIVASTTKRHAVVAPTGVAAINAGGVTIHSFFQLPFDPYLPDVKELVTEYQMPERYKALSKNKQNIIRTLELLIIDEVSMVRADLLDAIDMTLRRVRRSSRPFGGVQLLLIGDVHQLSPVVTEAERPYMERVYPSPYFFASKALQQINYVTIELTKVYRQQDAAFVDLLNHVRDNNIDSATLAALNARVGTSQKGAITLTTHNRQADAINRRHMDALHGEQRTFEAIVKGNYPDKALPCDQRLEVKVGGQEVEVDGHKVMVRQKTQKQFVDYSGKHVPYIPMHTLSAMVDYRLDFNNMLLRSLTLGANLTAQGKTYWDEANVTSQNFYALLGLHALADFGTVSVNLWARNLTDTKYTVFGLENVKGGNYIGQRGNPIQFGLDCRLKF